MPLHKLLSSLSGGWHELNAPFLLSDYRTYKGGLKRRKVLKGVAEEQKKHCELALKKVLGSQGRREMGATNRRGGGWGREFIFHFLITPSIWVIQCLKSLSILHDKTHHLNFCFQHMPSDRRLKVPLAKKNAYKNFFYTPCFSVLNAGF